MKSDDYVKFLTEQFVHFMETPRSERKTVRIEKKKTIPSAETQSLVRSCS
ncbi:YqzE family protein [Terrilactibacillus sp. S3-3]|nr:YqzE family protein [Terrilactibacillus sp. S3-3]